VIVLPPGLERFVTLFNAGAYWDSHEALEAAWRLGRSPFYHGMILYASALVHAQRGNAHGVRAQLVKAEARLAPYRPAYLGIDVDGVFAHAERVRRAVADGAAVPPHTLALEPALVRGTEPELGEPHDSLEAEPRAP
jgi:hypothetical protein